MSQHNGHEHGERRAKSVSRRRILQGAAGLAATTSVPTAWIRRAGAAGKVVVRTIGGAYEEANVKAIFEPFMKATGIEVVKVPATLGKVLAMAEAGNMELDLMDAGELGVLSLRQKGALDKVDYKSWKLTRPDDIEPVLKRDDMVGNILFSTVLGYNTQVFPTGQQPRSWAEFWDLKKFPGPRMLADLASGSVELEFALLADGVPKDKLYPIDIDRAFKSLDRVRPGIRKFWDTGALSAQMLADKEVVLGSIWNGRLQAVADKGAPLSIEWNEACLQTQFWAPLKGAKNAENGQRFIDFACQPEIQANVAKNIPYGQSNRLAFKSIPADVAARLPNSPEHKAKAFLMDGQWWADNRGKVSERWSQWLLQKG
ncbi:MAG TPA: ABC transporter substrate-binding protein [Candidatus Methylomirabilis sp.]|nr:ABC transporter substrate-binding protein [Candidatus Methylomirabilis sp.]